MSRVSVQWEVTNRCNLRCKHCLPLSGDPRPNELSPQEAKVALAKFQSVGATLISFTGGEAFFRPDFPDLILEVVKMGMQASVITNATLLNGETLLFVQEHVRDLAISLDGATASTNDFIRGKGTFNKTLSALQSCRELNIPVRLNVTITKANIGELTELARIAAKFCPLGVFFSEMNVAGRALQFRNDLALSDADRKALPVSVAEVVQTVLEETLSPPDDDCWVDSTTLFMTAEGNLCSCIEIFQRRPELSIGNIRSLDMEQWQRESAWRLNGHKKKCCYGVYVSEHAVFVSNRSPICAFSPERGAG